MRRRLTLKSQCRSSGFVAGLTLALERALVSCPREKRGGATCRWLALLAGAALGCHSSKPVAVAPPTSAAATSSAPASSATLHCPEGMILIPTGPTPGGWAPRVTPGFCIDTLEVTVGDYRACVRAGACAKLDRSGVRWCNFGSKRQRQPINCADFDNAAAYCRFRGKRLPAPNEWGRAARGDAGTYHPWGNSVAIRPGGVCWQKREPCDVGTSPQDVSAFGVRDMAGNVSEWTADPANEGRRPGEWHSEQILGGDWESTPDGAIDALGSVTSRPRPSIVGMRAGLRCAWPARGGTP